MVWVELAKRDYPQEWSDLIPSVIALCNNSVIYYQKFTSLKFKKITKKKTVNVECALIFLRSLAESTRLATRVELPKKRKVKYFPGKITEK